MCVITLPSCNKDKDYLLEEKASSSLSFSSERDEIIDDNSDGLVSDAKMILGDSIPNPYNINRMQQAFDLFNQVIAESPFDEKVVTASHYYVKIVLDDIEDLNIIYDLEDAEGPNAPLFFMHPLHLVVLSHGDYYYEIDTNQIKGTGTVDMTQYPIYTVIKSDFILPTSLNVEILDNLYKPSHEEHIVKLIAYHLAGWNNHFGGFGLPDHLDTLLNWVGDYPDFQGIYPEDFVPDPPSPDEPDSGGGSGGGFHSNNTHGRITVQSTHPTNASTRQPVPHQAINYGRYIWWFRTQTNEDGWFATHQRYNGTVNIRADWGRNSSTASIRQSIGEKMGFFLSDHIMEINSLKRTAYITFTGDREKLWNKTTIHTGIYKYNQYCQKYGINRMVKGSNTIVWSMPNRGAASNPMLNRYEALPAIASFINASELQTWNNLWQHSYGIPINATIQILSIFLKLPDQIYGLDGDRRRTEHLHQVIFHESSHFSHALQAGQGFWAKTFSDQLLNSIHLSGPYGIGVNPTNDGGQRIALVEGWANLAEVIIALDRYQLARINSSKPDDWGFKDEAIVLDNLEDFYVHDVPFNIQRRFDRGWFLHGLMWDLLDDEVDVDSRRRTGNGVPINFIEDQVFIGNSNEIYDLSPIFNLLTTGVENAALLRTEVLSAFPAQSTEINQLFNSYGY